MEPKNAEEYNNRGEANLAKRDFEKAIEDFSQAIKLNPNDAGMYVDRSAAYYAISTLKKEPSYVDKAIDDCNQAIKLNPDFASAYSSRGASYSAKGDYDKAIEDLNQAIRLNPNDENAYLGRGSVFFIKEEYERAIKDFETLLRINPNNLYARKNIESARMFLGTR